MILLAQKVDVLGAEHNVIFTGVCPVFYLCSVWDIAMSVPPGPSRSGGGLEKAFAVLLGVFALAVIVMVAWVLYSCFTPTK